MIDTTNCTPEMKPIIESFNETLARLDAIYHNGLIDIGTLGLPEMTCKTDSVIVTRTRREYDLITNGLLRLMKDITDTNTILNGGSSEVTAALDNYYAELKDLLDRITSIEKEE